MYIVGLCILSSISFTHAILKFSGNDASVAHIILVSVFCCVYQSTIGPFYWIYIPEVLKIKDMCYPMACLWFTQLVLSLAFNLRNLPQGDGVFYTLFGSFSLLFAGLIYRFSVETKGVPWIVVVDRLLGDSQTPRPSVFNVSLNHEN